jgi:hypothetical protein
MAYSAQVRLDVNPQVAAALEQLGILLDEYGYSAFAKARIWAWTVANGTPTGCRYLDREDESDATDVFVASLPEVPFDSPAWDRDTSVIFDVEMLVEDNHPWPIPTVGDDDRTIPPDADLVPPEVLELAELGLAPIGGGSPEPEPAAPGLVEGVIRGVEDHGTIIIVWIKGDDRSLLVPMDHRPFGRMAEGEGNNLVGRHVTYDGETITFLD